MRTPVLLPQPNMMSRWPFVIAILLMMVICIGTTIWLGIHLLAVICLALYTRFQLIWARIKRRKALPRY